MKSWIENPSTNINLDTKTFSNYETNTSITKLENIIKQHEIRIKKLEILIEKIGEKNDYTPITVEEYEEEYPTKRLLC